MESYTPELRSQPLENAALSSEDDSDGRSSPPAPTSGISPSENMAVPAFVDDSAFQENTEDIEMEEEERRRAISDGMLESPESATQPESDVSSSVNIVPLAPATVPLEPIAGQELAGKVDKQGRELTEIKRKLTEVEQKLAAMEEARFPASPAPAPAPNSGELLAEARGKEAAGLEDDRKSLVGFQQDLSYWSEAATVLQEDIQSTIEKSREILATASQAKESFGEALQERLQGRHQGMELIGKMLARLTERAASLRVAPAEGAELQPLSEAEWNKVLQGGADAKKLDSKLRGLEAERYQAVTQARDLAEGQRKRLLNFIEKQMLPIVDAIDDGEKLSRPFVTKAEEMNSPGRLQYLNRWFDTYSLLRAELLGAAAKMNVRPMTIQIGEMVDYMRHEPFDTVRDPSLPTEAIKEEMRSGYEHRLPNGQAPTVLRAAQVVVVKN